MLLLYFLLTLLLVLKYIKFKLKYRDVEKFPGPKTVPILGNVLDFGANGVEILKNMNRLAKKYGTIFRVWINPFTPTLMLSSSKHIEEILSSTAHIRKSFAYVSFKRWLGNGIFTTNEKNWSKKRKLLTPTMHFKILDSFLPIFIAQSEILIKKLKASSRIENTLDILPYANLFALDNICETSMGTSINAQDNANLNYIQAIAGFLKCQMKRQFSLHMKFNLIYKLTRTYRDQEKYTNTVISFTNNIINQKKQLRAQNQNNVQVDEDDLGLKRKTALMELLLDMEKDRCLTQEEIREEVDTFMFGGHDTMSSAISFILFTLSRHPAIQEGVLQEMKMEYDGCITTNYLKKLHFTERVIKESLRIFPAVPYIERELTQDIVLDGLQVPAKTTISILIYALHHNKDYFPEPEIFNPDRFLPENCNKRNPYSFIPFSAGPRNCIGQKYAYILLKVCLVHVLMNFKLCAVPGFEPILKNDGILKSSNGLLISLKERKDFDLKKVMFNKVLA